VVGGCWSITANNMRHLIGSGKRKRSSISRKTRMRRARFDSELSPSQRRSGRSSPMTVADRHEIILDIFGTRDARSPDQVDLARWNIRCRD
jgi:50S ribosomal subunit-associated GTPase HflX